MRTMRTMISILIVGVGLLLAAGPLAAHHSVSAEFDADKNVTLRGTVTRVEWANPHVWIDLDVKGQNGEVVNWAVEAGAPNALLRHGFTKTYLPPGAEIVVDAFLARDGSNRAKVRNVTTPDGKKMFLLAPDEEKK